MNLSDEQRVVVGWDDPSQVLLVTAKAGTGKTTTAAESIGAHLASGQRILALTFTRNGTCELVSQFEAIRPRSFESKNGSLFFGRGVDITIATFDSFLRLALRRSLVPQASWRPADLTWVCEQLRSRAGSTLCTKYPQWFKSDNLTTQLRKLCSIMELGRTIVPVLGETLEPIVADIAVEAARQKMLLPGGYAQLVMAHSHDIARQCLSDYDYLLVDESQDTSRHELGVLTELATQMRIVCLGDPGQNLMAFRGALGDLAVEFNELGVPYVPAALSINRRSLPALVYGQNSLQSSNGWRGKYASPAMSPEGVEPLVVVGQSEGGLLETLLCVLYAFTDQGKSPHAAAATGELGALISDRTNLLARVGVLTDQAKPSIVILVPTNEVGRSLESALHARDIMIPFLQAEFNPFDTSEAMLLRCWCNPEGELLWARIQSVLEACFRRQGRFGSDRAKIEMTKVLDALSKACSEASGKGGSRLPLVDALAALAGWVDQLQGHPCVLSEQAHDFLYQVKILCRVWLEVHCRSSLGMSLDALCSVTMVANAKCWRGGQLIIKPIREPWIFREARSAGVNPSEISMWIDEKSRMAKLRPGVSMRTVYPCIKTVNRAKGDTVDVSILYRADKVPLRDKTSVMETRPDRRKLAQDGLGLGYVAASRARYVHIELALGKAGSHHQPSLPGWVYHAEK